MSAQSVSLERTKAQPMAAEARSSIGSRLLFVDNIRVFLTILVILHHLMITYAGTGRWYYNEGRQDAFTGCARRLVLLDQPGLLHGPLPAHLGLLCAGFLRPQGSRPFLEGSPDPPGDSPGRV